MAVALIISLVLPGIMTPAYAKGKYDWFANNTNGSWLANGIVCFKLIDKFQPGQKFTYTAKLGQSKKFVTLGSGLSVSGDTLVDLAGNFVGESQESETSGESEVMMACPPSPSSSYVAYIAPTMFSAAGAWTVKLTIYKSNGAVLLTETYYMLNEKLGIDSSSSFFTNPPNIFFNNFTYANIPTRFGIKSYTDSGKPRNACLLVYDLSLKGITGSGSVSTSDLTKSLQGGSFGANVKAILGNAAIPTALKCAPWVATYMW